MKHAWLAFRLAVILLLFLAGVFVFQDRLLYFPENPPFDEFVARQSELAPWPGKGDLRGLLREPAGKVRATVIVFHGNAGHAGQREGYADRLARLGLRVILAEYPGYGPRPGRFGEDSFTADAAQTIALAHRNFGAPVLIVGESLGAAVAAGAVAREAAGVAGLLLITPWDRLENVARHHYGVLPVRWLLRDRYDSVAGLAAFHGRIAVAVAERDTIVPARLGKALYEALPPPRRLLVMPGVDHNDWFDRADESWWRAALAFLLGDEG